MRLRLYEECQETEVGKSNLSFTTDIPWMPDNQYIKNSKYPLPNNEHAIEDRRVSEVLKYLSMKYRNTLIV